MSVIALTKKEDFTAFISSNAITVVHFYASWAAQCETINSVIDELAKQQEFQIVKFGKCEAEELSDVSLQFNVTAVPTVVIFNGGKVTETVNGANAAELTSKLEKLVGATGKCLEDRLKALTNKSPVVVFMKGNPQQPRCGFSKTLMALLDETKIPFTTFDILQDEEVRQGLKTFSNWPTYPQVYVKGELIGGLDILQELKQAGELAQTLQGK